MANFLAQPGTFHLVGSSTGLGTAFLRSFGGFPCDYPALLLSGRRLRRAEEGYWEGHPPAVPVALIGKEARGDALSERLALPGRAYGLSAAAMRDALGGEYRPGTYLVARRSSGWQSVFSARVREGGDGVLTAWIRTFWNGTPEEPAPLSLGDDADDRELLACVLGEEALEPRWRDAAKLGEWARFVSSFRGGAKKGLLVLPFPTLWAWRGELAAAPSPNPSYGGVLAPGQAGLGTGNLTPPGEPAVGFRAWVQEGGRLEALVRRDEAFQWASREATTAEHHADGEIFHPHPPFSGEEDEPCPCGLHAFSGLARMVDGFFMPYVADARQDAFADFGGYVLGAVMGWGKAAVHAHGWRSEKARPIALLDPLSLLDANAAPLSLPFMRARLSASGALEAMGVSAAVAGASLGLPVLSYSELEAYALERGKPLGIAP